MRASILKHPIQPATRHTTGKNVRPGIRRPFHVERLECRTLLSSASLLYVPHATVDGATLQAWSARWWKSVFAAPIYAADGKTVINPQMADGAAAKAGSSADGKVAFLYGAFDGLDHQRGTLDHPVVVPAGAPLFMPLANSEWSNPDTASRESGYKTVPGHYSASELAHFADVQTGATFKLNMSVDGQAIPQNVLFTHRETAPIFTYYLPPKFNIDQVFFNENISGHVTPAAADGYYVMLKPLSPGLHTLVVGGASKDLSADPPQLGASASTNTYIIYVLPPRQTFTFNTVARINAPTGGHAGDTFSPSGGFEPAGINNNGTVAFAAYINDAHGMPAGEGVYFDKNNQVTQFIRQGDPTPAGSTYGGFGTFSPGSVNNNGDVAIAFGRPSASPTLGVNSALFEYLASTGKVIAPVVPGTTPAPKGGTFQGVTFRASINDAGTIAFAGIVHTRVGPGASGDLGVGIFTTTRSGRVHDIASPGDAAPGGGVFDFAENPSLNNAGDVAFGAHIKGEPVISLGQTFPAAIFAAESVYLKNHSTGTITSIAHQGGAIPVSAGGGTYDLAFAPVVNNAGQVVFIGSIRTSGITNPSKDPRGVFLYSGGKTIAVARPGAAMPGGGTLASASFYPSNYDLNDSGQVVFNAMLTNGQEGLYTWKNGALSLIAKTGTVIPGVGTIKNLDFYAGSPSAGAFNNIHGQVLFGATLKEGGGALLVASPATGA